MAVGTNKLKWIEFLDVLGGGGSPFSREQRMAEDYDRWLGPATDMHELKAMLKPYDASLMEAYAVSRAVNSVKNDTEECIEPLR